MPDPAAATASQVRNIEQATGLSMADFAREVEARGIEGHARIIAFLKAEHGLSHGNANAVAHRVRELAAGGPSPADDLLEAQYAGPKAALRPIYDRLRGVAEDLGPDVEVLVQKTGVAFRRRRQFGLVQAPSAKRVTLGLNLGEAPGDAGSSPRRARCAGTGSTWRRSMPWTGMSGAGCAAAYDRAG